MKKQNWQITVLAGLSILLLGAISAAAQAPSGLVVQVPFSFMVEHQQLPAGEYRIQSISAGRLLLRRTDGALATTVLTIPVKGKAPESEGKVVFHRYGSEYFLAQVWTPAQDIGRETLQSRAESELAKKQAKREVALLSNSDRKPR